MKSSSLSIIQIKATKQNVPVVLVLWMNSSVIIQMKATELNFLAILSVVMMYKVVLTVECLECDHSNESYRAVLSCTMIPTVESW